MTTPRRGDLGSMTVEMDAVTHAVMWRNSRPTTLCGESVPYGFQLDEKSSTIDCLACLAAMR